MQVDLAGKVAWVTGSGSGIGKAIALALARNGATVVGSDINQTGQATADQIGGTATFFLGDVSRPEDVERIVAASETAFGRIDILVNNAGIGVAANHRRPVQEFDADEWRRVVDVDLNGLFYCTRAVSPGMVKRRAGVIVNIASVMGMMPIRMQIPYAAAKAGVVNFSRSSALELAPHGIRVNAIAPGSTLTAGTRAIFYSNKPVAESLLSHIPLGRPAEVEDIAHAAVFLVAPESSYITGTVLTVDGGWTAGFAQTW
jgi:NAD(P)-dependent dehydrogenase (short-subunit alcohol dehydrogenase family)